MILLIIFYVTMYNNKKLASINVNHSQNNLRPTEIRFGLLCVV